MDYLMAHDLGTTGNKATLYTKDGLLIGSEFIAYDTYYPGYNCVEQDGNQWWQSVVKSTQNLMKKANINPESLAGISFSGQMMGAVAVDRNGELLRNPIIWADQRSMPQTKKLEAYGMQKVYQIAGTRVSPTFSGEKIAWLKENEPEVYEKTYKFLLAKDYIIMKLTGKFRTDYSDASMTNIFDVNTLSWSEEICSVLDIDRNKLPEIVESTRLAGHVTPQIAAQLGISTKTGIYQGGGDGACASTGAGINQPGEIYAYLGSSSWLSTTTDTPIFDPEMRTFNFCHTKEGLFCPTGTMQAGGASYNWAKDTLCSMEENYAKDLDVSVFSIMDDMIDRIPVGSKNLLFLPYLLGERSPHWNPNAKGAYIGLKASHTKAHLLRAVLEGVTFNLNIILGVLENVVKFDRIRVIGGGAKGRNWQQILADVFNHEITIPQYLDEATSMGAAIVAGVGANMITFEQGSTFIRDIKTVKPIEANHIAYMKQFKIFNKAYKALEETFDLLSN
ncbi:MAG TPA: xylulokinase [Thermotogota bacterium]|nr:xylulokinase [Thermotogota bacterium]